MVSGQFAPSSRGQSASADVAVKRVINALSTGAFNRKQHLAQAATKHSGGERLNRSLARNSARRV
ncbi:hypothetical protein BURKHO8Y_190081 [Burkholderia sp. 8Y]|nr:hypothetical protein BURKHO8Y_190081 [Burkholderia sp. 8Y]